MRKRILETEPATAARHTDEKWLDLDRLAAVEVTSEDPAFPIENVFLENQNGGWRASQPGVQQIRIMFDEPTPVRHIQLRFEESKRERTQEFTLRYSPAPNAPVIEVVRQQWSFSPGGSTTEIENYSVNLPAVSSLELSIRPDSAQSDAIASLSSCRLA